MANPFPFVAGDVLTAAELNGIGEAWTSYTPVIKGGATTVTATLTYAKYARVNKVVFARVDATITSAGAVNGGITVSLPVAATQASTTAVVGSFMILKAGVAFYAGAAVNSTTSTAAGTAYGSVDFMGASNPSITLANLDKVSFFICYEVA